MNKLAPLLQANNISYSWNKDAFLENVSLALYGGDFTALIGSNGAGKSTLLRVLAGILKIREGQIDLNGNKLPERKPKILARQLIYAPQNALRPAGLSVRDMVLQGRFPWLSAFGFYSARDYAIASKSLQICELNHLAFRNTEALSGGEWQRALLARVICQSVGAEKPVIILDEIASGLDPARAIDIFSLLAKMQSEGCAILASIHDCNLASMFANNMLALDNGKILFSGKTADVFTVDNLSRLYNMDVEIFTHPDLGCPQMFPRFKNARSNIRARSTNPFCTILQRNGHKFFSNFKQTEY